MKKFAILALAAVVSLSMTAVFASTDDKPKDDKMEDSKPKGKKKKKDVGPK